MIGESLGPYEIVALLGKGGMGEVYRARDPKLERDVAIKVLPPEFAEDEGRLLRFEREARVLASLDHSNIGAIYGFESEDSGDKPILYLVLEYVEGQSLQERLRRGALPIGEALDVGKQIAEALETAHEKGIVHRDLKPANVLLKEGGQVKVLDFGLARAMSENSGDSRISDSPTITADLTSPGVVLGTAPYMSPEQARGKSVDKRADIWAFGCCLYECLVGTQTFTGDTVTDLFADIIKGEPDWKRLPKETPWKVRELLERCLTKDPMLRLRDIGDARIELGRLSTQSGRLTPFAGETTAPQRPRRLLRTALPAGLLLAGTALGVLLADFLRVVEERPPRHLAIHLLPEIPDNLSSPSLSPDGSMLLFKASEDGGSRWYLHDLTAGETRPAPHIPDTAANAFLSWDGTRVGYVDDGRLWHVGIQGGAAREIPADRPLIHVGAAWGEDGTVFFIAGEPHTLYSMHPEDDAPRLLYDDQRIGPAEPVPLPGNKAILLGISRGFTDGAVGILDLESRQFEVLLEGASSPRYLSSGHLLFVEENSLKAVSFDPVTRQMGNERFTIPTAGIEVGAYAMASYTVSRDEGAVVFLPGTRMEMADAIAQASRFSWHGDDEPWIEGLPMVLDLDISPDGRWLAVSCVISMESASQGSMPTTEILRFDLLNPDRPRVRMAAGVFQVGLRFSPDGTKLAYAAMDEDDHDLFVIPVLERQAEPAPLAIREGSQSPTSWTRDSGHLLFQEGRELLMGNDVWKIRADGSDPEPLLDSPFLESQAVISVDGQWLAFAGTLDGQEPQAADLYVDRFPPTGRPIRITNAGAGDPQWDPREDQFRLYYRSGFGGPVGGSGPLNLLSFSEASGDLTWTTEVLAGDGRLMRVAPDGRILVEQLDQPPEPPTSPGTPEGRDRLIHVSNLRDLLLRNVSR